jgi:subtilisin family serine protease
MLDGSNYFPGGIAAPNVITVGNIDNDRGRHLGSDGSDGVMPGSGAEITLGAPGDQSVWGVGIDGQVQHSQGGTSSATPMVSATAALIRSIDPTLSAAEIKKMIADSAAQGDPEVGGKTLRADLAVRKAIDDARARLNPKLGPLTDAEIAAALKYCEINVTGALKERLTQPTGTSRWEIRASVHEAKGPTSLSLVAGGGRPSNWRQAIQGSGQAASWLLLVPANGEWIIVTRQDNGYWLRQTVRDTGTATPPPTATPTTGPTASPPPTPAESTYDCSNPPERGTIAYAKWSLHCKPIAP